MSVKPSFVPSNCKPLDVSTGWFAEVDCVAWLPLPLLSLHWLTALEEWVIDELSAASNQRVRPSTSFENNPAGEAFPPEFAVIFSLVTLWWFTNVLVPSMKTRPPPPAAGPTPPPSVASEFPPLDTKDAPGPPSALMETPALMTRLLPFK